MMKKLIAIFLALLVGCSAAAIVIKSNRDDVDMARLKEISEKMTQLVAKRGILEREIEDLWNEYYETVSEDTCYTVLFVDNITPNVMEEALPAIYGKYGYHATVVMSDLKTPGDEGCISLEDYNVLIGAGWDFAIGTGDMNILSHNGVEKLGEYIDAYKAKLEEKELPMPETFCFDPNEYDEKFDDLLWEKGFKVVRHYGEAGGKFSKNIAEDRIYHLSCGVICSATTTMKADMNVAISNNYTYSASVRYIMDDPEDINRDCAPSKYNQMLTYIYGTPVLSASELCETKTKALSEHREYLNGFNEEISQLEERLQKINDEIEMIVK